MGGVYRIAERAGPARAKEWALTSEQVLPQVMERHGVVTRFVEARQADAAPEVKRVAPRKAGQLPHSPSDT
jgi:enoyl-CoA hydratase/carnithine racemase